MNHIFFNEQFHFGASTFFAKQHEEDLCGSNGLPVTPNSIVLYGKAQFLKTLIHPNLCQYLDIIRGRHERTIVVSQYCGEPLNSLLNKGYFVPSQIRSIVHQVCQGLNYLHERNVVHRNLSTANIFLQEDKASVKLFDYGLYYMTGCGNYVSFPIIQVLYAAPEVYFGVNIHSNEKVDVWALGIILVELILDRSLWNTLNLGQRIRKILSLTECSISIFEKICREHNCYNSYLETPDDLKSLIEECLNLDAAKRPTVRQLLTKYIATSENKQFEVDDDWIPYRPLSIGEVYHLWQLVGGDVFQELKKHGLIRSIPPILTLPCFVTLEGHVVGNERNPARLYDPRVLRMNLDALAQRFAHIPKSCLFPILYSNSEIIKNAEYKGFRDESPLPLIIRERDPEYQLCRIILFRRLLYGYPFTRREICLESIKDIPPYWRADIWSALLAVQPALYKEKYAAIDKSAPTPTDRQIEVDIPRCHQYNELLSSKEGHQKLKRILKGWVNSHPQYVYWQGLDSLTAPFLFLNFNDEAKAFACLSAFITKYLYNFFLKDNAAVIQEYLAKFSQIIAFHDAVLANHLANINFSPELFAIPWFLTAFSHVFPLHKIFYLWDKLLLNDSSYPLFIGLAVLLQMRDRLMSSGFNECILLFSDLPEIDMEKCVILSVSLYECTPKSITSRNHENLEFCTKGVLDIQNVTLIELKEESCPRISATDAIHLVRHEPINVLVIDIRDEVQYQDSAILGSINVPLQSIDVCIRDIETMGKVAATIRGANEKVIIVVGNVEDMLEVRMFAMWLLHCNTKKVCMLHGGLQILADVTPSILTDSRS